MVYFLEMVAVLSSNNLKMPMVNLYTYLLFNEEQKLLNYLDVDRQKSEPSKLVIKSLSDFARSYSVVKTSKSGMVEMNAN